MAPKVRKQVHTIVIAVVVLLVGVAIIDAWIILSLANYASFPKTIEPSTASTLLQSLVQIDGVMIGFAGAVFAVIIGFSPQRKNRRVFAATSFVFLLTVMFFLLTIVRALMDLASTIGLQSSELGQLLSFTVNGVILLFFTVIVVGEIGSAAERTKLK